MKIFSFLIFTILFACTVSKRNSVPYKIIKKDVALLNREEFDNVIPKSFNYREYYFNNSYLIHIYDYEERFSILPLEEDNSSLALVYSKQKNWNLDTFFTTAEELEQLRDSSEYFKTSAFRCKMGLCEWYGKIFRIDENNQLNPIFEFLNFNEENYLNELLAENRAFVSEKIGEVINSNVEIVHYYWKNSVLKEIHLETTTDSLEAIINDSLVLKSDTIRSIFYPK